MLKSPKRWLHSVRERNATPIDTPYTFRYTLGELPLPQPWRANADGVYFVPSEFVLIFTDKTRLSLLRVSEPKQIEDLERDMLEFGIKTPLEMYMDANGKVRLQEGHHRMCVVINNLESFPKVPITLKETNGSIKSFGRPLREEFSTILTMLGNK